MAGGIDSSLEKQRRAYRIRLFEAVTKQPAEKIRALALKSRDDFAARLTKAKDVLGSIFRRWKTFEDDLFEAQAQIDEGDKLMASTAEADREQRRKFYGRAYVNLIAASDRLAVEESAGSTGLVFLQEATEAAEQAVRQVAKTTSEVVVTTAEKAAEVVDETVSAVDNKLTILAVGVALALTAFGFAKGRR
jgi:predicted translin family RNA/ssDNA-binding protein